MNPPNGINWDWLHVDGMHAPHGRVYISGTPKALLQLAEPIKTKAKGDFKAETLFYPTDGEGYHVKIRVHSEGEYSPVPYSDPIYRGWQ